MADQHDESTMEYMIDLLLSSPDIKTLDDHCGMETSNPLTQSSDSLQQKKPIEIETSHQVSMPTSVANFSMSMNPANTIGNTMSMFPGCTLPVGYGSKDGQINYPADERIPNISCSTIPQLDQYYHHSSAQFAEITKNYTNQEHQQQRSLRNDISPYFTGTSQGAWISTDARLKGCAMEKAPVIQNQFIQSQDVRLAHPVTSQNEPHHFVQGLPQDSTIQVNAASSSDWDEEQAFQEILRFQSMHLSDVVTFYKLACEMRETFIQARNSNMVAICTNAMDISGKTIKFLHMSKSAISNYGKEKFYRGMKCLRDSLDRIRKMHDRLTQLATHKSSPAKKKCS